MQIDYIKASELSTDHKLAIDRLNHECFADVDQQEVRENFIAKPFAYLFAQNDGQTVGRLALFRRQVKFEDITITLGGMGGVCVIESMRRRGVATDMLKQGFKILKTEECDIACLNVDLDQKVYGVYEKVGFRMMEREITFENVHGQTIHEKGTMFVPVCSQDIFDRVMASQTTFHYGRGYW